MEPRVVAAGVKDGNGVLVRDDHWKRARIDYLMQRRRDCFDRARNCERMIAELAEGMGETPPVLDPPAYRSSDPSIWRRITKMLGVREG